MKKIGGGGGGGGGGGDVNISIKFNLITLVTQHSKVKNSNQGTTQYQGKQYKFTA